MRMARETKLFSETGGGGEKRRALSLIVLFLFTACALLMLFIGRRAVANTNEVKLAAQPVSSELIPSSPAQDYSRFSHSSPGAHAALSERRPQRLGAILDDRDAVPVRDRAQGRHVAYGTIEMNRHDCLRARRDLA